MPDKRSHQEIDDAQTSSSETLDIVPLKRTRVGIEHPTSDQGGFLRRVIDRGVSNLTGFFGGMVKRQSNIVPPKRSEMRAQKSTMLKRSNQLPIGASGVSGDGTTGTLAMIWQEDNKQAQMKQIESGPITTAQISNGAEACPSRPFNRHKSSSPAYPTPQSSNGDIAPSKSASPTGQKSTASADNVYLFSEGSLHAGRPESDRDATPAVGTASQPIEVGLSDSEDEGDDDPAPPTPRSQSPLPQKSATLSRTRLPSRPDLSDYTPQRKDYSWLSDGASTSSRESLSRRKRSGVTRTNLRSAASLAKQARRHYERKLELLMANEPNEEGQKRIERMLADMPPAYSPARIMETRWKTMNKNQSDPRMSKYALAELLAENDRTKDLMAPKVKEDYSMTKIQNRAALVRKQAQAHRLSSITDLREQFEKTQLEEEQRIAKKFRPACPTKMREDRAKLVSKHLKNPNFSAGNVRRDALIRLQGTNWLNDEIINDYGDLIVKRNESASDNSGVKKIHMFNSFFYTKFSEAGYPAVRRWTRKASQDLFSKDIVLMPINSSNLHWTAGAINIKQKRFEYYDSMGGAATARRVLAQLRSYLEQEHLDKKKSPIDLSEWTDHFSTETPQQNNGSDCGIFSVQTLEALARGKDLTKVEEWDFAAQNMPYIRDLMIVEIAQRELEPRWPSET